MGYLNSEKPPGKWSPSFFKMFVERLRTAVNYLDSTNFPEGLEGFIIKDRTVTPKKLTGLLLRYSILALAEPFSTTSTTLVNVGGYLPWDTVWGDNVTLMLEVVGTTGDPTATATFELHGIEGKIAEVSTSSGDVEVMQSPTFEPPSVGQTLLLKMKTSNATYPASVLSATVLVSTS